jgi:hypothetical protein
LYFLLLPLSPLQVSVSTAGVVAQIILGVMAKLACLYLVWQLALVIPNTKAVRRSDERGPPDCVLPHPLILIRVPVNDLIMKMLLVKF